MKIIHFQNEQEWMEARDMKITGSKLGDVITTTPPTKEEIAKELEQLNITWDKKAKREEMESLLPAEVIQKIMLNKPKKIGFYQLCADRLAKKADDEDPRDRGHRLESYALDLFAEATGKMVDKDLVMWVSDDDESMAVSPDGSIVNEPEAVEAKCLSSARHLQALLTQKIPDDYEEQGIQYFIINKELQTLWFAFYDDRLIIKQKFFYLKMERKDYQEKITEYEIYQKNLLNQVHKVVAELSL